MQLLVLGYERTDAYAAFRISFRHGVYQNHVVLDAFEVECRDVRRPRVDVFAVNLVREEEQVVLLHQIAYLVHLLAGI